MTGFFDSLRQREERSALLPLSRLFLADVLVGVDHRAVTADREVQVRAHLDLRRGGRAHAADHVTGGHGLPLLHRHVLLKTAVTATKGGALRAPPFVPFIPR